MRPSKETEQLVYLMGTENLLYLVLPDSWLPTLHVYDTSILLVLQIGNQEKKEDKGR